MDTASVMRKAFALAQLQLSNYKSIESNKHKDIKEKVSAKNSDNARRIKHN